MRTSAILSVILLLAGCASETSPSGTSSGAAASPSSAATSPSDVQPSVSPAAEPIPFEDIDTTALAEGTYVLHYSSIGGPQAYPTLAITFTLPAGWDKVLIDGLVWNDAGQRVGFSVIDNLYVDPCDPDRGVLTPPVGPSVTDLASAMAQVPGWELLEADHDRYMGYPGIRLVLSAPDDMSACMFEESRLAHSVGFPGFITAIPGGEIELWILSVEGTRLVVSAVRGPDSAPEDLQALQAVIESISIRP